MAENLKNKLVDRKKKKLSSVKYDGMPLVKPGALPQMRPYKAIKPQEGLHFPTNS